MTGKGRVSETCQGLTSVSPEKVIWSFACILEASEVSGSPKYRHTSEMLWVWFQTCNKVS